MANIIHNIFAHIAWSFLRLVSFLEAPFLHSTHFQSPSFLPYLEPSPIHLTKFTKHHWHGWYCATGRNKAGMETEMVSAPKELGDKWRKTDKYEGTQQSDKCNKGLLDWIRVVTD